MTNLPDASSAAIPDICLERTRTYCAHAAISGRVSLDTMMKLGAGTPQIADLLRAAAGVAVGERSAFDDLVEHTAIHSP
jgi:hypothetical protein